MKTLRIAGFILSTVAALLDWPALASTNSAPAGRGSVEAPSSKPLKLEYTFNPATNDVAAFNNSGLAPTNDAILPVAALPAEATLSGTNLSAEAEAAERDQARLRLFQSKLELGRQQRLAKDFEQSEKVLKGLLESTAPLETKRPALLEMALLAQDSKQFVRAQQIYSQFIYLFHEDPCIPELLLRQGVLYREMGAPVLALSKFYAVMSSALSLKLDRLDYYQRLVLQAQTEIAETYYLQGQFTEAADFFTRLLKLDNPQLNQAQIHYKLIRSYSASAHYAETAAQAELFAARHPKADQIPEVRFLLADALKRLGRKREAMQQVLILLQVPHAGATNDDACLYWQQRAGNEIANQLYQEGDCLNALEIYLRLGELNPTPSWRLPVWYQVGLIYEHLKQPEKAADIYSRILETQKDQGTNTPIGSLATVLEMANWRKQRLTWQTHAELANQQINNAAKPSAAKP
jgi:tetratricopeptide (TPR) repeat protein